MVDEIKKGKVIHKVSRNDNTYEIEPIIVIKYNINVGKTFDNNEWIEILKDNDYYYFDRIAQNKLKKSLTEKEVRDFLTEKGASDNLANQLIIKYLDYGYIDDNKYTKLFIELRKTKDGPTLLMRKLKEKGINVSIINKHLNDVNEYEILEAIVVKKFKVAKNKTSKQIITSVKSGLLNKGYTSEIITEVVNNNKSVINVDELSLLEKEYHKLYNKRKANIDIKDFKYKTRNKLLQKGYNSEQIKLIENEYNE